MANVTTTIRQNMPLGNTTGLGDISTTAGDVTSSNEWDSEVSNVTLTEMSNLTLTEMSNSTLTNISNISNSSSDLTSSWNTNETLPEISNMTLPEISNMTLPEILNMTLPEISNVTLPDISNVTLPEISNVTLPYISNVTLPEISNVTLPDISNVTLTESPVEGIASFVQDLISTEDPHGNFTSSESWSNRTNLQETVSLSQDVPSTLTESPITNFVSEYVSKMFNGTTSYSTYNDSSISEPSIWSNMTTVILGDTTDETISEFSHVILWLKAISLIIIAFLGLSSNGFIIYTIVKEGNLHRPPFYYLLSLCVSDLSRSVFCVPLVLMTVLQGSSWKHGTSACKLFAFANSFFIYSSAVAILAIAIDRHLSVVHYKYYKRRSRGLVNLIVVVVGWTIAFTMSFPPVVGLGSYVFIPEENQCTFHHKYYKSNDTLAFVMVFTVIVFLSVFLYSRVFSFLRSHRKMRPLDHPPARSANWTFFGPGANGQALVNVMNGFGANPALNPMRMQVRPNYGRVVNLHTVKNEHLTRLFFVLTCSFCSLWFPNIVVAFWRIFDSGGDVSNIFVTIAAWLTYIQVALCPVMYILSRGPIRKHSRTVLDANDKKEFLLEAKK